MRPVFHVLFVLVLLGGCSNSHLETEDVSPAVDPIQKSGLTKEEQLAAIAEKYNIKKPEEDTIINDFPFEVSDVRFGGTSFVDQPESVVNEILGEPVETKQGEWQKRAGTTIPYVHHIYQTNLGQIEIMFVEGKATRLAIKTKEERDG